MDPTTIPAAMKGHTRKMTASIVSSTTTNGPTIDLHVGYSTCAKSIIIIYIVIYHNNKAR